MIDVLENAQEPEKTDDDIISELAAMSALDYERSREAYAETMGVRVSILDKLTAQARENGGDTGSGRVLSLYQPEPWPEQVDGAATLHDALAAIQRHMAIDSHKAASVALWTAHAHIFDAFGHSPRLAVTAPEAECGKSRLIEIVGAMVPRPQNADIMKAAPFFRLAELYRPIFLIDEADIFIRDDSDLLAALNNGWEPCGTVIRCVGVDFEPRAFSTHTPVVVGGVKLHKVLPATTLSRSIIIELERAINGEVESPYQPALHRPVLLTIGRKLARWCADHRETLRMMQPDMPGGAFNRRADKWKPLFAIAQLAGGAWPTLARNAYLAEANESEDTLPVALQLLGDIKTLVKPFETKIFTSVLIDRLCALEDSPWREYNFKERYAEDKRIKARQIANLLKPYKIHPATKREGTDTNKGYDLSDFINAWDRYLGGILAVTPSQISNGAGCSDFSSVTPEMSVTDRKSLEPNNGAGCDGVTDKNPLPGQESAFTHEEGSEGSGESYLSKQVPPSLLGAVNTKTARVF